jgi:hypothetical protein
VLGLADVALGGSGGCAHYTKQASDEGGATCRAVWGAGIAICALAGVLQKQAP